MDKRTVVVNKRHTYYDVYVGRGSVFGNKFIVGKDGTRQEVIQKYSKWFFKKLKSDRFRVAVDKLRGKRIGCYCRPREGFQGRLLCHGQIIASYLDSIRPEEVL